MLLQSLTFGQKVDVSGSDRVCWLPSSESAEKYRFVDKNQTKIPNLKELNFSFKT
jgi:hypothetical protein